MIDDREIALWIARLETEDSSWANYEKLAALYTIQDRQSNTAQATTSAPVMYSAAPAQTPTSAPIGYYGDSDFLRSVAYKTPAEVWPIMDELMSTLQVVNPRAYKSVMRKIDS